MSTIAPTPTSASTPTTTKTVLTVSLTRKIDSAIPADSLAAFTQVAENVPEGWELTSLNTWREETTQPGLTPQDF